MICSYCGNEITPPNYIALLRGSDQICRNCHTPGISDGYKTRHSDRIAYEQRHHSADFVEPHVWDKSKRRMVINPDFVKLYPDKMRYYENEEGVSKQGYSKLGKAMKKQKERISKAKENLIKNKLQFSGNEKKGIERLLK